MCQVSVNVRAEHAVRRRRRDPSSGPVNGSTMPLPAAASSSNGTRREAPIPSVGAGAKPELKASSPPQLASTRPEVGSGAACNLRANSG
eukprot:9317798-Pyramimonas_sp.AAC.1